MAQQATSVTIPRCYQADIDELSSKMVQRWGATVVQEENKDMNCVLTVYEVDPIEVEQMLWEENFRLLKCEVIDIDVDYLRSVVRL